MKVEELFQSHESSLKRVRRLLFEMVLRLSSTKARAEYQKEKTETAAIEQEFQTIDAYISAIDQTEKAKVEIEMADLDIKKFVVYRFPAQENSQVIMNIAELTWSKLTSWNDPPIIELIDEDPKNLLKKYEGKQFWDLEKFIYKGLKLVGHVYCPTLASNEYEMRLVITFGTERDRYMVKSALIVAPSNPEVDLCKKAEDLSLLQYGIDRGIEDIY